MQVKHGTFGLGSLLGPLFVFLFSFYAFAAISVLKFVSAPGYVILKSP